MSFIEKDENSKNWIRFRCDVRLPFDLEFEIHARPWFCYLTAKHDLNIRKGIHPKGRYYFVSGVRALVGNRPILVSHFRSQTLFLNIK